MYRARLGAMDLSTALTFLLTGQQEGGVLAAGMPPVHSPRRAERIGPSRLRESLAGDSQQANWPIRDKRYLPRVDAKIIRPDATCSDIRGSGRS
jgi:hypothetical protein